MSVLAWYKINHTYCEDCDGNPGSDTGIYWKSLTNVATGVNQAYMVNGICAAVTSSILQDPEEYTTIGDGDVTYGGDHSTLTHIGSCTECTDCDGSSSSSSSDPSSSDADITCCYCTGEVTLPTYESVPYSCFFNTYDLNITSSYQNVDIVIPECSFNDYSLSETLVPYTKSVAIPSVTVSSTAAACSITVPTIAVSSTAEICSITVPTITLSSTDAACSITVPTIDIGTTTASCSVTVPTIAISTSEVCVDMSLSTSWSSWSLETAVGPCSWREPPIWTGNSQSKFYVEVYLKDPSKFVGDKDPKPIGWGQTNASGGAKFDPEIDLVIRIKDINGLTIRHNFNSLDFWTWCPYLDVEGPENETNKDTWADEGTHNPKVLDTRIQIRRIDDVEDIDHVDTPYLPTAHMGEYPDFTPSEWY